MLFIALQPLNHRNGNPNPNPKANVKQSFFIQATKFNYILPSQLLYNQFNNIQPLSMNQSNISQIASSSLITTDELPEQVEKRPFFQRAFAPMNAGAMRGSIFALLASAMGSGMFNLPYRVDRVGIIPVLLYILAGGLFSYIGMYLISRLIIRFKISSYSEMCEKAYGVYFKKIAQFCLIFYPWGITICFQIIFSTFVIQILDDVFHLELYAPNGRSTQTYTEKGEMIRICVIVFASLLNLIFVLKKDLGVLQKISILGVISIVINVFIIAITFLIGFTAKIDGVKVEYQGLIGINWSLVNWIKFNSWNSFTENMEALAGIIFCFVNHQLVFPLVFDLKDPTKKRLDKVFHRVHQTEILVYLSVGLTGYLLLSQHVDTVPINSVVMGSIITSTMTLGKMFMIVALFFAVPLNLFPAREVIYESFSLQKTNKNHIIISLALSLSGAAVAIVFQSINSYFGLLGGTAGVMMAGGIPAICYFKLKGPRTINQKLLLIFVAVISMMGMCGAILSVISNF